MSLATKIEELVSAGFAGLWITTFEPEEAIAELSTLADRRTWSLAVWDIDRGLQTRQSHSADVDPLTAIRSLRTMAAGGNPAILVLHHGHRFLATPDLMQACAHAVHDGKAEGATLVVLAPSLDLPVELRKRFVVVEHDLPDRTQLLAIAREVAATPEELPTDDRMDALVAASEGLTRMQAEGAFALSIVRHGRIDPETVWSIKAQELEKSGLLTLHRGGERFTDLGGMSALKEFCTRALRSTATGSARPRGILLLGVPGVGKSAFAKSLGTETGRPTIVLDIGRLMGSLVGETESNVRHALRLIDAMGPSIVFLDEIEKGLAGVGGGSNDSGVSARLFGSMLTWLNDRTSDSFVIATANDVSRLPPEFARAERFDGVFFLDLPGPAEREAIWSIHLDYFGLNSDQTRPNDDRWTGAEIRACCRLATLLGCSIAEAAERIIPVADTASDRIEALRTWASSRCLAADRPGRFRRVAVEASPQKSQRPRVRGDAERN